MRVLVTGGAGYIGSHTCVELLACGHQVHVLDNFSNSSQSTLDGIADIAGRAVSMTEGDVRDAGTIEQVFDAFRPEAVIHFAAAKAVGESWERPLDYYDNNVAGTTCLLNHGMKKFRVGHFIFSSSATVYGESASQPIREDAPTGATNPYGRTKLFCEEIIRDHARADPGFHTAILRYFNPAGAHPSTRIGENPNGVPSNLFPYISQVAAGMRPFVRIFGNDYLTPDGTGVRDYIHVVDLARAHVDALAFVAGEHTSITANIGTGRGYSVNEVVSAFQDASGVYIPTRVVERRPGDVPVCFADPALAAERMGWKAELDLVAMCRDAWGWQKQQMVRAAA